MPKIKPAKPDKPKKPYPDFPLFAHASGRWAKKIRGKFCYFGPWDDPNAALQKYVDQRDALYAGRSPRSPADGLLIKDLANHYLTAKHRKLSIGEIRPATFKDCHRVCSDLVAFFGRSHLLSHLASDDFGRLKVHLAKTRSAPTLSSEIQRVRSVFKYGFDSGLLDQAVRFGAEFTKPPRRLLRKARQSRPLRLFSPKEIHDLLDAASTQMKAMIFLGINGGLGNTDCAELPRNAVDLKRAVIDYPRPKTAVERRVPLWPETVEALDAALAVRTKPKDQAYRNLVFITRTGVKWVRSNNGNDNENGYVHCVPIDALGHEFGKILRKLRLKKLGFGFYCLRHSFKTVADEVRDAPACDRIMGHEAPNMASRYVESISNERLKRVTDHVRGWLCGRQFV